MERILDGFVIDKFRDDNEYVNYLFSVLFEKNQKLFWKIKSPELYSRIPELIINNKVPVIWDDINYQAFLKLSELEKIPLIRDFNRKNPENNTSERIEILKCESCGSNVPLGSSEKIECDYCGKQLQLPDVLINSIAQSKQITKDNEKIFGEITNLFTQKISPVLFKVLSIIPLILVSIQILIISYGTFFRKLNDFFSDEIIGEFFMEDYNLALSLSLPSLLITLFVVFISRKNAFLIDLSFLYSLFSPNVINEKQVTCRNCGNPLKYTKIPEFISCPYCKTENIVMTNSASLKNISNLLKINYLIDIKILHSEFKTAYKKYFVGILIGLLVFFGSFTVFTFYVDDMRHVSFLVRYIAMPFVVLILFHLLSEIAFLPYSQFSDWIPKYFKKHINNDVAIEDVKISFSLWLIPITKFGMSLLFFITVFFMR